MYGITNFHVVYLTVRCQRVAASSTAQLSREPKLPNKQEKPHLNHCTIYVNSYVQASRLSNRLIVSTEKERSNPELVVTTDTLVMLKNQASGTHPSLDTNICFLVQVFQMLCY